MNGWGHLAGRFFESLRPGGPPVGDRAWVERVLIPAELALWERLGGPDRRHTVAVARRVEAALAGTPHAGDDRWLACAFLHDIGKLASGFGVFGRVVATLAGRAAGWRLSAWEESRGFPRRVSQYLRHGEIGADMIMLAGGREEAAAWAAGHHDRRRIDTGVFPATVMAALVAADDE